ncbi:MAG: hypothetical protein ACAI43_08675 [Phycisphaerae bacterium]
MADESQTTVRGINWRETFPFTQIFRAFRVAIHPTKLILGLVALLALYFGGRVLDMIWPISSNAVVVYKTPAGGGEVTDVETEVGIYDRYIKEDRPGGRPFSEIRERGRRQVEAQYMRTLGELEIEKDVKKQEELAKSGAKLGDVKAKLLERKDKQVKAAAEARDARVKAAPAEKQAEERKEADRAYARTVDDINEAVAREYKVAKSITGQGVFMQFFEYETGQINSVVQAVLANDWLGGFANNPAVRPNRVGVLAAIKNFTVTGPWWLITQHTTYFILFAILFSVVWAIFGGAISRIAAVHVAREEKISLSSALRFSTGKFLSFAFAPIIPLLIVLVVGLVVSLGGLIGNIPWIGPVLMGLFFFLALAAGFVMTLVLLGTAGGFNLMYPTIAVEGSDSFDAISRSFSYVYARPWRMLFYTLVAVVYGALCFLFVQFFLRIMLTLTHGFVGWGMMKNVDSATPVDLWGVMWPAPTTRFSYDIDTLNLHTDQALGAYLIAFWVYIAVGLLGAFFISFYFSANTIIYYLMRREVDATELDDVYLEQTDEDFGDAAPGTVPPAATTPPPAVAAGGTTTVVTSTGTHTAGDPNSPPPPSDPQQTTPPPAGG